MNNKASQSFLELISTVFLLILITALAIGALYGVQYIRSKFAEEPSVDPGTAANYSLYIDGQEYQNEEVVFTRLGAMKTFQLFDSSGKEYNKVNTVALSNEDFLVGDIFDNGNYSRFYIQSFSRKNERTRLAIVGENFTYHLTLISQIIEATNIQVNGNHTFAN